MNKYSKDSKDYDKTNNLVIGKKSFLGLKAKMYTYITVNKHKRKKVKGINNSVVEVRLKYED